MTEIVELRLGTKVWLGGASSWEVVALHGTDVTLRCGGRLQRVALTEVSAHGTAMSETEPDNDAFSEPAAAVWSSLTEAQRRELETRGSHLRSMLGAVADGRMTLAAAMGDKAKELHVSVRTLER